MSAAAAPSAADRLLRADKVRRWCWITLAALLVAYGIRIAASYGTPGGLSRDFLALWAASSLSLAGEPLAPFDTERFNALTRSIGAGAPLHLWSYPPPFQLLVLPLALVPPLASQLLFAGLGALVFALAWRRLLPHPNAWLVAVSSPLFVTNLYLGQTGIWVAALYAIGLASLAAPARGWPLGATAFGLAIFKPHLGLLVPLALLLASWRALALASAAAAALVLASLAAFGPELWSAFVASTSTTYGVLEAGAFRPQLLTTFFATFLSLGAPVPLARAAHALLALLALALAVRAMLRCRDPQLRVALAVGASQLAFPYAYYYDLMALAPPLAVLAREGLRDGWLRGEREALALLWIGPLPLLLAMERAHVSLGVVFPLLALALLARRALAPHASLEPGSPEDAA
jgi:hypothetical protein